MLWQTTYNLNMEREINKGVSIMGTIERRNGLSFDFWKIVVDKYMVERFGVESDFLPDWEWWALWDAGVTAKEAFTDYVENDGFFG